MSTCTVYTVKLKCFSPECVRMCPLSVYHLYAHSSPQLHNVSNLAGFNILQPLNKHFACKVGLAIIISIETIDFKLPILFLLFATAYYYNLAALVTIDLANICRGQIIMPALQPAHFCFEIGTQ